MKKKMLVLFLCIQIVAMSSTAFAASAWTEEAEYGDKVLKKLSHGVSNLLMGWTELLTEPMDNANEDASVLAGIGKGLWNALGDTIGGALHLVTFPVTSVDVPLPEGGVTADI